MEKGSLLLVVISMWEGLKMGGNVVGGACKVRLFLRGFGKMIGLLKLGKVENCRYQICKPTESKPTNRVYHPPNPNLPNNLSLKTNQLKNKTSKIPSKLRIRKPSIFK
jgi:hypothetical protein